MASKIEGLDRLARKLRRIPDEVRRELKEAIRQGAEDMTRLAKRLAPVDDGDLQMSITYRWGNEEKIKYASLQFGAAGRGKGDAELTAIVSAGNTKVRYAHLVEFGAKPHTIKPKSSQGSLAINGNWLAPGQSVQHPGQAAQPFFFPAYRATRKSAKARISRAVTKAAKKVAAS
jgi:HK97 gp10 family phage protein